MSASQPIGMGNASGAVAHGSHAPDAAICEQCGAEFRPRINQGPNKSRFCKEACRNRYHRERREMNPLERSEPFSLTLANPNPKFRTRKDGDRHFIEFEVSAEEWGHFVDPNVNRKGMVIEAIHCEVTHQHVPEKVKAEEKPKGGALAELAGMWCKDWQFLRWLEMEFAISVDNETEARALICSRCGISSRAQLDHDGAAKRIFEDRFRKPYANYLARLGR